MKASDQYLKLVYWSDEDGCYIGRSPGLFHGGVHGDDEADVFQQLIVAIEDVVETCEKEDMELPPPTATGGSIPPLTDNRNLPMLCCPLLANRSSNSSVDPRAIWSGFSSAKTAA